MVENFGAFLRMLTPGKRVLFLTHKNPDLDGMSTAAALACIAHNIGCEVEIAVPDKRINGFDHIEYKISAASHVLAPELLVVCDVAVVERIYYPENIQQIPLVLFDHHQTGDLQERAALSFVDSLMSSTAELVTKLILDSDPALLTQNVTQYLFDGMAYDSQFFRISATNGNTLRCAAALLDAGAIVDLARERVFRQYHYKGFIFRAHMLARSQYDAEIGLVWLVITHKDLKEAGQKKEIINGIVNELCLNIFANVAMTIYVQDDELSKVSLRASGDINVHALAAKYGGGGHIKAAGVLTQMSPEEVIEHISRDLKEQLVQSGRNVS